MESFSLDSLKEGLSFTDDLLIDSSFILLPKTVSIEDSLLKLLSEWNINTVLCNGNLSLGETEEIQTTEEYIDFEQPEEKPKEKISTNVKKIIEDTRNTRTDNTDQARIDMVLKVYTEYVNYIEQVFTHYVTHKEIDKDELSETVQELCVFIKDHKRYILRINHSYNNPDKNFLVVHAIRSTVLSIAIAQQLHVPLSKMIELGVTCIIHEIGMLRLPPQLYMTTKKLNASEKLQITKHTVLGYSIVKDLNFSLPIQLGVLEHHEKSNGSGYPRHLTGDQISAIGRIIAVACTYEAISSPRSYKDDRSSFDALLELIQNKENQYDGNVLKALLYTVSLYPIGTYVYLTNRKIAEVIDSNPTNPKCPLVQLITEKEPDGSPKIIQTNPAEIFISRILTKQEEQDIINLLEQKKKMIADAQKQVENENKQQKNFVEIVPLDKADEEPVYSSDSEKEKHIINNETKKELSPTSNQPVNKNKSSSGNIESQMEEIDINFFN